jgi:hypothetical protein
VAKSPPRRCLGPVSGVLCAVHIYATIHYQPPWALGPRAMERPGAYYVRIRGGGGVPSGWGASHLNLAKPRPCLPVRIAWAAAPLMPATPSSLGGEARCTTRVLGLGSLASDWLLALPLQRPHIRLSTVQRNA